MKGFVRSLKPLDILSEEQVALIHRSTLEVLWTTGLRMEHQSALRSLETSGCRVDYDGRKVYFPPGLVEDSLRRAPSSIVLKGRRPENNVTLGGNVIYFKNACGTETIDLDSKELRNVSGEAYYAALAVLDSLDSLHILGPFTPYFGFDGVPSVMAILESCAGKIRNSTKAQIEGYSNDSEIFQIGMAQAVQTEILQQITASSPMTWSEEAIQALLRAVEADFPITLETGQAFGGTAPATLAGALITNNAEIMGAMVLAQVVKPGTRVQVGDFAFPVNMSSGCPVFGGIETALHQAAFNQIWRKYEIPVYNVTSGYSCSKNIDFQTGYEKTAQVTLSAISGANVIGLHGAVSSQITFHPVQAILDDDLAGMIGRFMEGITVDEETLAVDLINEVGPIPGHFLNKQHTRKWWKLEQFVPRAADRLTYPEWTKLGKKSCLDYARERMEEILATHKRTPLTPGQEEDVERILEEARKHYKEKGLISEEEMAIYRRSMESSNYPYG